MAKSGKKGKIYYATQVRHPCISARRSAAGKPSCEAFPLEKLRGQKDRIETLAYPFPEQLCVSMLQTRAILCPVELPGGLQILETL